MKKKQFCFFVRSSPEQFLQEQYSYADYRILKDLGFDVVVAHRYRDIPLGCDAYFSWWASGSILPFVKALISRKPIIVVAGGNEATFFRDSLTGQGYGYLATAWYKKWATRLVLRFSNRILIVSRFMEKDVRALGAPNPLVVHNCIDTNRFRPDNSQEKKYITSIFRLETDTVQIKRGEVFLRAIPRVLKEKPEQQFLVIGSKDNDFERLQALAQQLGIDNNITFAGGIKNQDIPTFLNASQAYVQISDTETFGVAIAEAMSCGVPVVVSDRGAIREVVGDYGIYVDHNSPDDTARGILEVLNRPPEEGILLVQQLRAHIETHFTFEIRKQKIKKIIDQLLC